MRRKFRVFVDNTVQDENDHVLPFAIGPNHGQFIPATTLRMNIAKAPEKRRL